MISSSLWLLLLLAAVSRVYCVELTQTDSVVLSPGQVLTLSCKLSGYSVSDSSYCTGFNRQPAGKALEWVGEICGDGSTYYSDKLKSRFSVTRDSSSNTVTLQGQNMQTEDTSVYYCAREDNAFDYWGKGTMVTVSSDLKKKPDVFTMSQCESSSDLLVIGCLASGFSPASLDFKWKDNGKDLNDFMEYPTVQNGVKTFKVSLLNITKEKFNQNNITCEARHQEGNIITPFRKVSPQKPTLSVVPVITQKSSSVMCVVENFYPRNLTVQLKEKDGKIRKSKLEYRVNTEGLYTAYSLYKVSSETWTSNIDYICEVTHQGVLIIEKANFKAKFALTLKPPIQKELFVKGKVVLEAVVSGDTKDVVEEATVSCNGTVTPGEVKFYEDISQFIRKHNVTVDTKKWFDGEKVTCTLSDKKTNNKIQQVINFNGDGQKPTVFIYSPDSIDTDRVTHVCEVTSPKLSDVYIMWIINEKHYIEGATSAPIHQNDSMSVFSILTMTKEEYEKLSTTITCAVKHANMKDINAPLQVSTSKSEPPEPETGFALDCNKDVLEEDEFRSLWSTATSFIFLFLFSLTYSAVLSLFKVKQ